MADAPDPTLKLFEFRDGIVSGITGPEDAEDFAADYQGLRHFAEKISSALELGDAWMGGFREADFTHLWSCTADGKSGAGAMLAAHAPLFELLQHVATDEA